MFWAMSTLISVTTPLLTFYMVIDVAVSTRIDFTIPFLHFHIVIPMEKLKNVAVSARINFTICFWRESLRHSHKTDRIVKLVAFK